MKNIGVKIKEVWGKSKKIIFIILLTFMVLGFVVYAPVLVKGKILEDASLLAWTSAVRDVVETLAIILAGYWALQRFEIFREEHPYPQIAYRVVHHQWQNGFCYLSVFVTVTNDGKTKLDLGGGEIYVRQVSPLPKSVVNELMKSDPNLVRTGDVPKLFIDNKQRIAWPMLGERRWVELRESMQELEPGQTRELQFSFILEKDVRVVEIVSSVDYEKSRWELSDLYDLDSSRQI